MQKTLTEQNLPPPLPFIGSIGNLGLASIRNKLDLSHYMPLSVILYNGMKTDIILYYTLYYKMVLRIIIKLLVFVG